MKINPYLFLILLLSTCKLSAQSRDFQVWNALALNQDLKKGFDLSAQYQSRIDKDISRFRGSYISATIGYKLNKHWTAEAGIRYSTSNRWDRIRYSVGIGRSWKWDKLELSAKAKYQYQYYLESLPEWGINPPAQNFRLKLGAEQKIIKKLKVFVSTEPMFRYKASEFYFRRVRNTVGIKWSPIKRTSFEASYIWQPQWNSDAIIQVMQFNVSYDLPKMGKKKTKEKAMK
jgi:hypothetical protein